MGELSKKIGEAGEDIVANYLKLIGWSNAQKGLDLQCVKPEKHTAPSSRPRQTHGIDFLFSYASPLADGVFNNLIISVKFSNDEYPSSPGTLFKDHFKHLVQSVECFKKSQER